MSKNPKDGSLLYHITALDNLDSIIENGLQPRNYIKGCFKDVADKEILKDREKYKLEEHTPFHFFAGTPFAGSVQIAFPELNFMYISIDRSLAIHNNFVIIPSHPLHYGEDALSWENGMQTINWDLMNERDYSNHECKEVCMAESLFKGRVLCQHFKGIYVKNESQKKLVEKKLNENALSHIFVNVNTSMFVK